MGYESKIATNDVSITPRACQACKNSCYKGCSGSCSSIKCKGDCFGSCKTSVRK